MKRSAVIILIVCLTVVGGIGGKLWFARDKAVPEVLTEAVPSQDPSPSPHAAGQRPTVADLLKTPQAREYLAREEFHKRARAFFANWEQLGLAERDKEARYLQEAMERYEAAGELSGAESLMFRIGLIRALEPNEALRDEKIADLTAYYQVQAERREAEFREQQQRDPRFQAYKAEERSIVEEVMAMQAIPGGLSRDEYLRQRLQEAREAAYSTDKP
jgi:hypothetical protein